MTIGEIYRDALRLMFATREFDPSVDLLTYIGGSGEHYGDYLAAMPAALNRALLRVENERALTARRYEIPAWELTQRLPWLHAWEMGRLPDLWAVEKVILSGRGRYSAVNFFTEGGTLLMETGNAPYPDPAGMTYTLLYAPRAPRMTGHEEYTGKLDIPDELARILPYFIKGELYELEEPAQAAAARNMFESLLAGLRRTPEVMQSKIHNVTGGA